MLASIRGYLYHIGAAVCILLLIAMVLFGTSAHAYGSFGGGGFRSSPSYSRPYSYAAPRMYIAPRPVIIAPRPVIVVPVRPYYSPRPVYIAPIIPMVQPTQIVQSDGGQQMPVVVQDTTNYAYGLLFIILLLFLLGGGCWVGYGYVYADVEYY